MSLLESASQGSLGYVNITHAEELAASLSSATLSRRFPLQARSWQLLNRSWLSSSHSTTTALACVQLPCMSYLCCKPQQRLDDVCIWSQLEFRLQGVLS